ncbi:mechanosensitive ion channel family protein [Ilumatobacter nonamiensis]|uniref:mechanosensitive ion channel family protein n=1 Tax=Ilumatobacter nonamiensis TaxID=467093 RepID=UPI00034CF237|nr:mechanosensitive ion channel family protein [Ilumatobacter nonamiensis]
MSGFSSTSSIWAIVVIVIVPLLIIATAELDERLRQRDSPFRRAAAMLRTWTLPFFAIWALLVPVLGVENDSIAVRIALTGLLLSIAAAVQRALRIGVDRTRTKLSDGGRRNAPELLLMLPKLAVVLVSAWLLIDSVWGIDLSAALTALGVTSLVISFALQDTLSGLASGVLLLSDQPIQPGHWIEVGDNEGIVVDINWRTTRIRNRDGDMIIVPNSELAQSSIVNHTDIDSRTRVVVSLTVAYVNPPTLAKAMLLDAALGTEGVLASPPPAVLVTTIDDPLMGYEVHMWIDDYAIAPRVKSDFGALVWYQSHRHNVPLPSPAQDLFIHDGDAVEAGPGHAEIRVALSRSSLLSSLDEGDLDRLAQSTSYSRYAVGELISISSASTRDLMMIIEGNARIVLRRPDGTEVTFGELSDGDIAGLHAEQSVSGNDIGVRAVTDCQVAVVEGDAIEEVASRSIDLAAAFNRMAAVRRRRAERMIAAPDDPTEADDDGAAVS